jgi:hypothetical protein
MSVVKYSIILIQFKKLHKYKPEITKACSSVILHLINEKVGVCLFAQLPGGLH